MIYITCGGGNHMEPCYARGEYATGEILAQKAISCYIWVRRVPCAPRTSTYERRFRKCQTN